MAVDMSAHFNTRQLLRYTLPSIAMMIVTSIYTVVDGFFVSNWAGETALAAVNLAWPLFMILGTVGFMLGTGGTAIVSHERGAGRPEQANRYFSLFVYTAIASGVLFAAVGFACMRPLLAAMGASGALLDEAALYAYILLASLPFSVLQYAFQSFVMAAGKPRLGLFATLGAGIANVVFDALFIAVLGWGVAGAALGTAAGFLVGGAVPLVYFARPNASFLRLGATRLKWRVLGRACTNGLSEMVTNLALSVVSVAYNVQLLKMLGQQGVAAYGVIMYVSMVFIGVFIGYAIGVAPLAAFQHGAGNRVELRSLLARSVSLNAAFGVCMFIVAQLAARPLAAIFVGYDEGLLELTQHALALYSWAFLVMGFSIFGSNWFTALGNGLVSALISGIRSLVFEVGAVALLPLVLGPDGIWFSVCVAELASLALTTAFTVRLAPRYGYAFWKSNHL